MKVILIDNVKNVGRKGEVVTVPDGLALNKLFPTKKALEATAANIAKWGVTTGGQVQHAQAVESRVRDLMELLAIADIVIPARADAHGTLYQTVHERDVVAAITTLVPKQYQSIATPKDVAIKTPIKKTGKYTIQLHGKDLEIQVVSK